MKRCKDLCLFFLSLLELDFQAESIQHNSLAATLQGKKGKPLTGCKPETNSMNVILGTTMCKFFRLIPNGNIILVTPSLTIMLQTFSL